GTAGRGRRLLSPRAGQFLALMVRFRGLRSRNLRDDVPQRLRAEGFMDFFNVVIIGGLIIAAVTAIPVFIQMRKHPKGLHILFFAEMWERFSFYGMRGLLIFFLTQHFLFDDTFAQGQYGAYNALVYLLPLLGGFLADRYLGTRKAIAFGALLLVAGHF